jgi:hypothetical protein
VSDPSKTPDRATSDGGSTLPPARPPAPSPARPATARPKLVPAREAAATDSATPAVEPDVAERKLEISGQRWTVKLLGRSGATSGAPAPLLLLGFWRGEPEGTAERERLVVGTALSSLGDDRLEAAFENASAPRDPKAPRVFFGETKERRR